MDTVQQQLYANIDDPSVEKCTRFVVKHLKKASAAGNISTLTRILYQIGGLAAHRGEKRKNSGVITIQAASKTRRTAPLSGRCSKLPCAGVILPQIIPKGM